MKTVLQDEFDHQGGDAVEDRRNEDAFGGLVLAGIEVERKQDRVGQQRDARNRRNQVVLFQEKVEKFAEGKEPVFYEIIRQKTKYGRKCPDSEAEPHVVLFEKLERILFDAYSCHAFSSCCLMV